MNIPRPWVLSTERTEWLIGKTRCNIFISRVVHQGIAYPLMWKMLDKKGNSNSDECMDLLDQFYIIFPDTELTYVCGDQEFICTQWLTYLLTGSVIPFRPRIRESGKIWDGTKMLPASIIFSHLQRSQIEVLSSRCWVWGRLVYHDWLASKRWRFISNYLF